ncbi:MAG: DmsC/YnfH family molybdoenzyme membrane anchor subunit [Tahibacter sp.]
MHPALSVIFFTTLSGAGYGLLFLFGVGIASGLWPQLPYEVIMPMTIGFCLVSLGLTASLSHLGQAQRAWRAFSQWRTSWLSREGVASVVSFLPVFALAWLYFTPQIGGRSPLAQRVLGALLVLCCVVTVYCTARIYSSLKTIRAWHNVFVAPGYLLLAVYSGGLWLWALAAWYYRNAASGLDRLGLPPLLLGAILLAALLATVLKLAYWRMVDHDQGPSVASATGLTGEVRAFEAPHTEENYITREMGFVVARRHAGRLRIVAMVAAFLLPPTCIVLAVLFPALTWLLAPLALLVGSLGIFVERWLFFAEARHVVTLYYGAQRA